MPNSESFIRGLTRRLRLAALAALGGIGFAFGQTSLVGNSPFAPAGTAAAPSAGAAEAYELAGSSVEGSQVTVCIFERRTKHSEWIPVGGISDGVHVISFDAARDMAVVAIGGARKELTLRNASVAALGSSAVSMAVAPAAGPAFAGPASVGEVANQEREARMLVSDLLEIGVQQRKAYQEAKQKAATGTPAQPSN